MLKLSLTRFLLSFMDEIVVKEIYFTNTAINVRGNNVQDAQIRMENRLRAKKKPNVTKKGKHHLKLPGGEDRAVRTAIQKIRGDNIELHVNGNASSGVMS